MLGGSDVLVLCLVQVVEMVVNAQDTSGVQGLGPAGDGGTLSKSNSAVAAVAAVAEATALSQVCVSWDPRAIVDLLEVVALARHR